MTNDINRVQPEWLIKIHRHTESRIKEFEDYTNLLSLKDTISAPKIGIDDKKCNVDNKFSSGILEISIYPQAKSTEITHKLMGKSVDNDAHKSEIEEIEIIKCHAANGRRYSQVFEKLLYRNCFVVQMVIDTTGARQYVINYTRRIEEIYDYDYDGRHLGTGRCEIDFKRGDSRL